MRVRQTLGHRVERQLQARARAVRLQLGAGQRRGDVQHVVLSRALQLHVLRKGQAGLPLFHRPLLGGVKDLHIGAALKHRLFPHQARLGHLQRRIPAQQLPHGQLPVRQLQLVADNKGLFPRRHRDGHAPGFHTALQFFRAVRPAAIGQLRRAPAAGLHRHAGPHADLARVDHPRVQAAQAGGKADFALGRQRRVLHPGREGDGQLQPAGRALLFGQVDHPSPDAAADGAAALAAFLPPQEHHAACLQHPLNVWAGVRHDALRRLLLILGRDHGRLQIGQALLSEIQFHRLTPSYWLISVYEGWDKAMTRRSRFPRTPAQGRQSAAPASLFHTENQLQYPAQRLRRLYHHNLHQDTPYFLKSSSPATIQASPSKIAAAAAEISTPSKIPRPQPISHTATGEHLPHRRIKAPPSFTPIIRKGGRMCVNRFCAARA